MAGEGIYLDTSGVLAFLDASDECHSLCFAGWRNVLGRAVTLVMTDYVRLETWSLVQRRLGWEALDDLRSHLLPLCSVDVVGEGGFEQLAAQSEVLRKRQLSLVDLSSFDCMRRRGIRRALAFDKHFNEQGFLTPEDPDFFSGGGV